MSDEKNIFANLFILLLFIWYMPMLFFLAGASAYYSAKKRTFKEYAVERVKKLLIPLLFGVVILVPPQAYLARLWRGEADLGYIEHLRFFFTNITDFTGFDGAFSPAHLWFILYLFIVSLVSGIFIFKVVKNIGEYTLVDRLKKILLSRFAVPSLILMGVVTDFFPSIMGKSIVGCLLIFMLGYVVYSDESLLKRIVDNRLVFLLGFMIISVIGACYVLVLRDSISGLVLWSLDSLMKNVMLLVSISFIVGYSSVYLNRTNKVLRYLNESAFSVYIIHQPILLAVAFVVIPLVSSTWIAMILIILISLILSFMAFEILKRVKILNIFFGLKQ